MGSAELAVCWLCTFCCHRPTPAPPPQSTSECIYLHLYRSRLKAIIMPAQRGQPVALAHSVAAKNIPSDVVVMQHAHVIRTSKKRPWYFWNVLASLHSCAVRNSDGGIFVCYSKNRYYTGRRPSFNDNSLLFVTNFSRFVHALLNSYRTTWSSLSWKDNYSAEWEHVNHPVHYTQTSAFISISRLLLG